MRLTLAITTYERPDALAAVLGTVSAQSAQPSEVIVADDGSGASTRAVVEQFAERASFPVHYVRQEHQGFRVARLRNLAIARASGEYIVFIDGDMALHREFLADHRAFARAGSFTQGVRIPLNARATARFIQSAQGAALAGHGRRRLYAFHNRALASLMRGAAGAFVAIKSCNQGFWRRDLLRVNGFDEDFVGWGSEDKELCARLQNGGIVRQTLIFGGIAYHLHHAAASRERHAVNERLLERTLREKRTRCERGLDAHL